MPSEINDMVTLEKIVSDLKDENEFKINISGIYTNDIIKIFKKYNLKYSRIGFKKWYIIPERKSIGEFDKPIVALRLFGLISTIILLFVVIFKIFLPLWLKLDSNFQNLPISSSIIATVLMIIGGIIVSMIGKRYIFKAGFNTLLKKYLWG